MRIRKAWRSVVSAMLLCSALMMTSCIALRVKVAVNRPEVDWEEAESTATSCQYNPVDSVSVTSTVISADVTEADVAIVEEDEEHGDVSAACVEEETVSSSESAQMHDISDISNSIIQGINREQNEGELDP